MKERGREGGREGGEGGREGEGVREGREGGRKGREGGEGWLLYILKYNPMTPQYLNINHVTYYVIT